MNSDRTTALRVSLSKEEAIVLFDWLSRAQIPGEMFDELQEPERAALNSLLCRLEEELQEPFFEDYLEHLKKARASLSNKPE